MARELPPTDPPLPAYAGIPTFLRAPTQSVDSLSPGTDVAVLGVPFDGAVSYKPGARYGPRAIRQESLHFAYFGETADGGTLVNVDTDHEIDFGGLSIVDCGDVPIHPTNLRQTQTNVQAAAGRAATAAFPMLLGGDHSITRAGVRALVDESDGPVGIIHVDAHSDTAGRSPLYGDLYHGSWMASLHESGIVDYRRHAMIGIRGHEREGYLTAVEEHGAQTYPMQMIDDRGIDSVVQEAIETVGERASVLYLTVDIDAIDPAFAPGTGTPAAGGLTSRQFLRCLDLLGACDAVEAMDLVEVAPTYDPAGITQRIAMEGLIRFIEARWL